MNIVKLYVPAGLAAALFITAAYAADMSPQTAAQQVAGKDFTKLSVSGVKAFHDVQMARFAIFNGEPNKATSYVQDAQATLAKAKTEDTVFMKAEADMKPTPGEKQAETTSAAAGTAKIAWIPVDGQMSVGEDYVGVPDKTTAAKKQQADAKKDEALKLSDLDVSFTAEVVPLEATISDVDKAASLLTQGQYYQASLALKSVEDGARFDTEVVDAVPAKGDKSHS